MTVFYWRMVTEELSFYQSDVPGVFLFTQTERSSLSLQEGWKEKGLYLFADICERLEELAEKIYRLRKQYGDRLRLLWVENPEDALPRWRYHTLLADEGGRITGQGGWRFSGYYFDIFRGLEISCAKDSFVISGREPSGCLQTPGLWLPFVGSLTVLVGEGKHPGRIKYMVQSRETEKNLLELAGAGMYYASRGGGDGAKEYGYADLLYSPVLEFRDAVRLNGMLHPSFPLCPEETSLSFPEGKRFICLFVNRVGECLELEAEERAGLVFEQRPLFLSESTHHASLSDGNRGNAACREKDKSSRRGGVQPGTALYLGLSGRFMLRQKTDRETLDILCGISGMEYICMGQEQAVEFVPGQNAFVTEQKELGMGATVSYLRFPSGSLYYCQPEKAPLFISDASGDKNLLQHPTALLRLDGKETIPMFPYFRSERTSVYSARNNPFEEAILRRRYALPTGLEREPDIEKDMEVRAVSVQGLLVGLSGNGPLDPWNWAAIGRAPNREYMKLCGIDNAMRIQMQRPDLFMVYKQPEELLSHIQMAENFELTFEGWRFTAEPMSWRTQMGDSDTLMLLKYSTGESIRQRLENDIVFSGALAQCYDDEHLLREEFTGFIRAAEDPEFQGCMILNCPLDIENALGQMLPQVRMMLAGIDPEARKQLHAHHLILHKSRIMQEKVLGTFSTAVDALVSFRGGKQISYSGQEQRPDAEYSTVEFVLKIENSEVTQLRSVSELLINRLFGAPCKGEQKSGNCLILEGQLREEEAGNLFVFSLREEGRFTLESGILESMLIDSAELFCQQDAGDFEMGGRMYFGAQENCDLFGYGFEEGGEDKGLPFLGLKLRMPGIGLSIETDYTGVRLWPKDDGSRRNAMSSRFPMGLEKLFIGAEDTHPEKLGYTLIHSPMQQAPLRGNWYGLVWRIPFGSLGNLSENSVLDMELLTAWSSTKPEGENPGCWLGIRLPGAFGGPGLDIQGLLKLGFQSVEIRTGPGNNGRLHYRMQLNQFKIRALWAAFPPGSNCIHIVPDEDGKKLGWFAGYADQDSRDTEVGYG